MKKYLLFTILSTLFFTNVHSQELDVCPSNTGNFYVKAFTGLNYLGLSHNVHTYGEVTSQFGYALSGLIGYRGTKGYRFEGEYIYRKNMVKLNRYYYDGCYSGNSAEEYSSIMANIIYDLPIYKITNTVDIQPFIGGGIGCDFRFNSYKYRYASWQVIAGLNYSVNANTDISLEYKLHKRFVLWSGYDNTIGLGLTYHFGQCRS